MRLLTAEGMLRQAAAAAAAAGGGGVWQDWAGLGWQGCRYSSRGGWQTGVAGGEETIRALMATWGDFRQAGLKASGFGCVQCLMRRQ